MHLHQYSATRLVKALQTGDLTPNEVMQHQLERIHSLNPLINAIVALNNTPPAPGTGDLAGLPITIKDQIHFHGIACTFGSELHKDFFPPRSAPIINRLEEAGAYVIGKTNLPPYAMDFQCSNALFGTTNNPWDRDYTTGGSSGGGAAAVAAGLSFLDIGTDLSGSLRIPASFCGVYSLLPTEHALSPEGMMPDGVAPLKHFARMGPIARTPDDLELAWSAMSGEVEDPSEIISMPQICWNVEGDGVVPAQTITDCFKDAAEKWAGAGFDVSNARPDGFDFKEARRLFGEIMGYETGELMSALERILARLFGRASARRSPEFIANVMLGYRHSRKRYRAALEGKRELSQIVDEFLGENRVWLLPVTATPVFKHLTPTSDRKGIRDYATPLTIDGRPVNYFDALTAFVTPISLTGHPVVTLPLGLDDNGLPVGAQLVGPKGREKYLIRTAKTLAATLGLRQCPLLSEDCTAI